MYAASVRAIPNATRFVPDSRIRGSHVRGDLTASVTGPEGKERESEFP